MSRQQTIVGAHIRIYINGVGYNVAQQVNYMIDYGEEPIYGVDAPFPQEIKITRISVQGSVSGLRLANSGGLQTQNIRPGIRDSVFAPYISLRIFDRRTGEDLFFLPHAKVIKESVSVSAKGLTYLSFDFTGLQPLQPLDRA